MPARMATLANAFAQSFAAGMLDVIAMSDGKRKLVSLVAPGARLRSANLVGIGKCDAQILAILG